MSIFEMADLSHLGLRREKTHDTSTPIFVFMLNSLQSSTFLFYGWPNLSYSALQSFTRVCLSVCLSVFLSAGLLKNACMDLDEMLRVDRCRDMDELINF